MMFFSQGEECVQQGRKSGPRFSGAFAADGDGQLLNFLPDDGDRDDDDVGILAEDPFLGTLNVFCPG